MKVTSQNISSFLDTIEIPRKNDIQTLIDMMKDVTGRQPEMWGTIIGFGSLHYTYKSGTEGDMPILGLANRKQAITLYLSDDIDQFDLLKHLGKYTTGKSCLYIKKLTDINLDILKSLMIETYAHVLTYDYVTINY